MCSFFLIPLAIFYLLIVFFAVEDNIYHQRLRIYYLHKYAQECEFYCDGCLKTGILSKTCYIPENYKYCKYPKIYKGFEFNFRDIKKCESCFDCKQCSKCGNLK